MDIKCHTQCSQVNQSSHAIFPPPTDLPANSRLPVILTSNQQVLPSFAQCTCFAVDYRHYLANGWVLQPANLLPLTPTSRCSFNMCGFIHEKSMVGLPHSEQHSKTLPKMSAALPSGVQTIFSYQGFLPLLPSRQPLQKTLS